MSGEPFAAPLAALPKATDVFQSVEFLITVGVLSVVLLGGAVVLYFTDIWRKRQFEPERGSTESMTSFRALYERGELTESEYQKIRDKMAAKMKQEVGLTPLPPPAAGPAPGGAVTTSDVGTGQTPTLPESSAPTDLGGGANPAGGAADLPPPPPANGEFPQPPDRAGG